MVDGQYLVDVLPAILRLLSGVREDNFETLSSNFHSLWFVLSSPLADAAD